MGAETGGRRAPPAAPACGWHLVLRYRLQCPVLGALPTGWDPLRGLPWRGHRYCASAAVEANSQSCLVDFGNRHGPRCGGSRRESPTGAAVADGTAGGPPPLAATATAAASAEIPLRTPRRPVPVHGKGPRSGGARVPPGSAALATPISRPSLWPVSFSHTRWRDPHHRFARVWSHCSVHRRGIVAGWRGELCTPPEAAPVRSQAGGGRRPPRSWLVPSALVVRSLRLPPQGLVRFCAEHRIKSHVPRFVRVPVNPFKFQPCGRSP